MAPATPCLPAWLPASPPGSLALPPPLGPPAHQDDCSFLLPTVSTSVSPLCLAGGGYASRNASNTVCSSSSSQQHGHQDTQQSGMSTTERETHTATLECLSKWLQATWMWRHSPCTLHKEISAHLLAPLHTLTRAGWGRGRDVALLLLLLHLGHMLLATLMHHHPSGRGVAPNHPWINK